MNGTTCAESAIVLSGGLFETSSAKTSHGLVRGPSRWPICGVVDAVAAGRDAGEALDGRRRGIPIRSRVSDFLDGSVPKPSHCIIGVATHGGVLPQALRAQVLEAARAGLTIVNGLHQPLSEDLEIAPVVTASGGHIIDIRKPKRFAELRFWSGEVLDLGVPRIAVLGTDCALGKRTTTVRLREALRRAGRKAEMIYTGQTGWLQGIAHGFIFDATPNDFVSGELERAILDCAKATTPDLILIEGQAGLRNPSGPCGSEMVLSGGARRVVLQHAPARVFHDGHEEQGLRIGDLGEEIQLFRLLGAEVIAITLNTGGIEPGSIEAVRADLEAGHGIPVCLPLGEGIDRVAQTVIRSLAR